MSSGLVGQVSSHVQFFENLAISFFKCFVGKILSHVDVGKVVVLWLTEIFVIHQKGLGVDLCSCIWLELAYHGFGATGQIHQIAFLNLGGIHDDCKWLDNVPPELAVDHFVHPKSHVYSHGGS